MSALEIPLIDLLLPNWTLRTIFGLIGLWGLVWMCGLLAVQYRMPHVVGPDWVRIRAGWSLDVRVPWDVVASVHQSSRLVTSSKSLQYDGDSETDTRQLVVAVSSRTNVTCAFRQPLTVDVDGTSQLINGIHLWADDPAALVAAARLRLESITESGT